MVQITVLLLSPDIHQPWPYRPCAGMTVPAHTIRGGYACKQAPVRLLQWT